jgi:hypothetical protein
MKKVALFTVVAAMFSIAVSAQEGPKMAPPVKATTKKQTDPKHDAKAGPKEIKDERNTTKDPKKTSRVEPAAKKEAPKN